MNIGIKILIPLSIFILISIIFTFFITSMISQNIIEEQIYSDLNSNVESRVSHIETILKKYKELTETLVVGNSLKNAVDDSKDYTQRIEQVNRRINNTIQKNEAINSITVLNKNGTVIASNMPTIGCDDSASIIFPEGKEHSFLNDITICNICGEPVITASSPIFVDGEFAGVCVVNYLAAKELYEITTDTSGLRKTGEIYLLNKDGFMISPSRFVNDTVLKQRVDVEHDKNNDYHPGFVESFSTQNYLDENVLRIHTHIPEMKWCVIADVSKEEALAPIAELNNTIFIITFSLIIIGLLVSIIISRSISGPINALSKGVSELKSGNLDHRLNITTGDEIELCANEFNEMSDKLRRSYSELESKVEERTKELTNANEMLQEEVEKQSLIDKKLKNKQTMDAAYSQLLTIAGKTIDLNTLLDLGLTNLMKYTDSPLGAVYLFDPQNNMLVPKITNGAMNSVSDRKFSMGEGIPGESAQRKTMVVVTDIPDDTIFRMESGLCESLPTTIVSSPMIFKDMLLGVIVTCHTGNITQDTLDFMQRVIDQFAVSVNNANSFTQMQVMAAQMKNQRDELEIQSKQLEIASMTKSEFLANMSHELRTPLNSIIGFSEVLHDQTFGPVNEKQLKYINNVLVSGKHLLQLINDILDLSKVEAGKVELFYEDFELSRVIDEVKTLIVSIASKKNISIEVNIGPGLTVLHADCGKFKQILFNLLSNAIKFSPEGEVVTVDAVSVKDMAQVSVTDIGIGISKEDQKKLFKTFVQIDSTASRQYEGTGLGLALVRQFAQLHGGNAWVESKPGEGSTFIFTIPIAGKKNIEDTEKNIENEHDTKESLSAQDPVTASTIDEIKNIAIPDILLPEDSTGDEPLILVVEDDKNSNELLTNALTGAGYRTISAFTGTEAVAIAQKIQPFAITLDIMLPGIDGWDVIKYLKSDLLTRNIPVIVISMLDEKECSYSFDIVDYFTKPVDKNILLSTLNNLTDSLDIESPKVLIVDDEPDIVELLASMIESGGYGIIRAYNGQEGIDKALDEHPDLMILDLMMPVINGFDVIKKLKSIDDTKDIPIIVCTAKDLTKAELQMLTQNVISIMQKGTFNTVQFLDEIDKITKIRRK